MVADATTIWQVPAYLPYFQPPLTNEAIAEAEQSIGFRLPPTYLALLAVQNGGYIRYSHPEFFHDTIAGIGPHFPSLTDFDWEDVRDLVSFELDGLVPFDGDGHWHLCFDYRSSPTPRITHVDVECDQEAVVADSFTSYLSQLQIDVDDELVIEHVENIELVLAKLAEALSIAFDPPSSWAHGYPTYRAGLGTGDSPQSLWLSPNLVRRGFVRESDPRFAELSGLLPGQAPRFPELPRDSYLVTTTEEARPRVVDACAQLDSVVRPIADYL